ncbi:class I SAM-dependent methyltransferase [Saccharopolyspora erythraea]|uniref:class I SAM-dependent methyltransferase n=1 Tax=Saccharopolyspora erythraea TaxID=1836 RepID=UPI001BA99DAD|nr:class I SAM-dependent methyltransferase [Saccharopolyspora erythraea]QUH03807.1 class I SAM-dependent methyltransferase [Saccharopolyspora erythraea]
MTQVGVRLTDAMETSLIMLYGLAMDARTEPAILGDAMALRAFERVDYDFTRLKTPLVSAKNMRTSVAARAKHFDTWAAEFLAAHRQATVLHLGAGLDPRVWRVDPGPGVRWYDIDYPAVVEAREKLFPTRPNYSLIASSVTDPGWLEQIPADRPVLAIAQGLTMYLRPADGHALFRRITDRFPGGTLLLDTHNRLGVRGVNKGLKRVFGAPLLHWAIDDPHELERVNPRLRCTDAVSAMSPALVDQLPPGSVPRGSTLFGHLAQLIPPVRDLSQFVRYEFDYEAS